MSRVFRDTYNRRFSSTEVMATSPDTSEGAFYVFQKALVMLLSHKENLKMAVELESRSPWFNPSFPRDRLETGGDGGDLYPAYQNFVPSNTEGTLPRIYAPSDASLEKIRELYEKVRRAERSGSSHEEMSRLNGQFLEIMREEIESFRELAEEDESGVPVIGMGVRQRGETMEVLTLDPERLAEGIEALGGRPQEEDPDSSRSGPGSLTSQTGSRRSMSPAARNYFEKARRDLNQPKTYAERVEFEMSLVNYGFELGSPEDPREGVPAYSPLDSQDPSEVLFGGAANSTALRK